MVRRDVVDAIGLPDASYFIFYDDVDFAVRARRRRVPDLGDPRRGAGAPARLRPAARPRRLEGVLHVPEPLRRPLPLRRERAGPAQAVPDRARRGRCSARCAAGRAEAGNVIRAIALALGPCARVPERAPRPVARLDRRVQPSGEPPCLCPDHPRPRRRRLRILRPDHRRALRERARPQGAGARAASPPRRQRLQRGRRRRPASRCTSTARTSSTPPTRRSGSTSTGSPRSPNYQHRVFAKYQGQVYSFPMNLGADQPVLRQEPHPRRGARADRRAGQRDRHRRGAATSRRRRSA